MEWKLSFSIIVMTNKKQGKQQQYSSKRQLGGNHFVHQIHTVLKTACNQYANHITGTAINCLLNGSKRLAKKVITRLMDSNLIYLITDGERINLAKHATRVMGYQKHMINKVLSRMKKPVFVVTEKGMELLKLLDELMVLCPTEETEEVITKTKEITQKQLAVIRIYSR